MLGQTLSGRYHITNELGRGGFGATFIATDMQRPGNPQCVVKQFKPLTSDPYTLQEAKRLFDLEAEMLELLGKHDQIPQLLAHFEENKEFFIVQEFIEGYDISQELPPFKPVKTEAEVIQLIREILQVLAFVHKQEVIHRDIKPSNIRRRNSDRKIILIDFGAVKRITTQMTNSQGHSSFTVAVGSPGYMPSEQASQKPQYSSDIFAVGIIAIQALTGINPPAYGTKGLPQNASTGEINWRDQVQVSPQLGEFLDTMVRYDFRQRFPTAEVALQALGMLGQTLPGNLDNTVINPKPPLSFAIPKLWLIGLAGTSAIALGIFLVPGFTSKQVFLNYEDSTQGIIMKFPQNWKRIDLKNPITGEWAAFMSPPQNGDPFPEKLTLTIEPFKGTLEEYGNSINKEITKNPESKIVNPISATTLAYKPAGQLVYTDNNGGNNLKTWQIWTLKGDQAYIISYTANINDYDKFRDIAETMIKSFEIK
jgi:eukaryotic-like serine/threonine-protein kinase